MLVEITRVETGAECIWGVRNKVRKVQGSSPPVLQSHLGVPSGPGEPSLEEKPGEGSIKTERQEANLVGTAKHHTRNVGSGAMRTEHHSGKLPLETQCPSLDGFSIAKALEGAGMGRLAELS